MFQKIKDSKFPSIEQIKEEKNLIGYTIKHNTSERLFYSPINKSRMLKLYDANEYKLNNYSLKSTRYIILRDGKIFKNLD